MRQEKEIEKIRDVLNELLEQLKNCKDRNLYKYYKTQRDMLDWVLGKNFRETDNMEDGK